jgi:hypothetical protein
VIFEHPSLFSAKNSTCVAKKKVRRSYQKEDNKYPSAKAEVDSHKRREIESSLVVEAKLNF